MATHAVVVTTAARAPLEIHQVPTPEVGEGEVQVRVEWTASTPLDLHQSDGGLLVQHPQALGSGSAGSVVKVGLGVKNLKVGDKVTHQTIKSAVNFLIICKGLRIHLSFPGRESSPRILHRSGISLWQSMYFQPSYDSH